MAGGEFATEVLADGPVGYWRFGEPPGSTTAGDASGHANDGLVSGGVAFGQRLLAGGDTAALFDGATGRVTVANTETLNPAQITMEAMIRWDGPTGVQQRIVEKESFAGTTQYGLSVLPDGRIHVELRRRVAGPAQVMSADSTGSAALGAATHVAATYDGLAIAIYLDGALDSTTTVNASPVDIDTKWPHTPPDDPEVALALGDRVGIIPAGGTQRTFNGLIDELALYAVPLPAERIHAHYEARCRPRFQYAAKVVCGRSGGKVVASGTYLTAVNVHNPNDAEVHFSAKVAIALPGFTPGPVSPRRDAALGPDEALEVDCPDIRELAQTQDKLVKGFLVLESAHELDVVAVYTVAAADGEVRALEIERVPARTSGSATDS